MTDQQWENDESAYEGVFFLLFSHLILDCIKIINLHWQNNLFGNQRGFEHKAQALTIKEPY